MIAEIDVRPVGLPQLIDPAEEVSRDWDDAAANLRAIHVWIGEADDLNRGHGTDTMRQAIARCFAPSEVAAIPIDPLARDTAAHRFFERLGFRYLGRWWFGDDGFVYRLGRERAG